MDDNKRLETDSGNFSSDDRLVSFLYELMRDVVTPGKVEAMMRNSQETPVNFSNGWLAKYSEYIAKRLRKEDDDG